MSRYWSDVATGLTPYVPGEQPKVLDLIKLNTNENPYPPSPRVLQAFQDELGEARSSLRRYPDQWFGRSAGPRLSRLAQTFAAGFVS